MDTVSQGHQKQQVASIEKQRLDNFQRMIDSKDYRSILDNLEGQEVVKKEGEGEEDGEELTPLQINQNTVFKLLSLQGLKNNDQFLQELISQFDSGFHPDSAFQKDEVFQQYYIRIIKKTLKFVPFHKKMLKILLEGYKNNSENPYIYIFMLEHYSKIGSKDICVELKAKIGLISKQNSERYPIASKFMRKYLNISK